MGKTDGGCVGGKRHAPAETSQTDRQDTGVSDGAPDAAAPRNVLYCGDNLAVLRRYVADESVDLAYLDPPFFSNRRHEVVYGDEAKSRSFDDRWEGGIQVYVNWMEERMREIHRVLKPTGSVYLHCDWHASHYLKVMMDGVFGTDNFLNDVVWCYGLGGSSARYWPRKHDNILWYSREHDAHFFQADMVPATSQRMKGTMKKAPDYWDIPTINNMAKERLGYPTQKPLALLKRIIRSSCPEAGVVLDPFCGSGTAIDAARHLGRRWIGIDTAYAAIDLAANRILRHHGTTSLSTFSVNVVPADIDSAGALPEYTEFGLLSQDVHEVLGDLV